MSTQGTEEPLIIAPSELGKILYDLAGGPTNVESAYNCMTRLRFLLKDTTAADQEAMKRVPGVLGTNLMEQELQIILGPGKATAVTNALLEQIQKEPSRPAIGDGKALHEEIRQKNNTPVKAFFKKIASIFLPLIPAFIGCGLLTGILAIAAKIDPTLTTSPLWQTLATLGGAIFWGMNLFVGWQAAKVFGGTPILGGALAAFVSHPGLKGIELFGNELLPGRGGIISVILIAALAVFIEKRLHKLVPEMLDLFVTPVLTLLLSGLAAVLVFQPIGGAIEAAAAVGAGAIGISGLPLTPTVNNIPVYLLGLLASYAAGFVATWLLGFDDPEEEA